MADYHCDLQITINQQHTFFLNQVTMSMYSKKLRKLIKQHKKATQSRNISIFLNDFPGGSNAFESITQFCYNSASRTPTHITVHNISQLYCASFYLNTTHKNPSSNLQTQLETFLERMFDWSWTDILTSIQTLEPFFPFADSTGLVDKLITTLLAKIAQNSDISLILSSTSSSSSSPDSVNNIGPNPNTKNNNKGWWFDGLSILSPFVIEKLIRTLGSYGSDNNSLLLTKFLLHYLKTRHSTYKKHDHCNNYHNYNNYNYNYNSVYVGLADTAIYGVMLMGKTAFSCRSLFWVLRLVSGYGLSTVCRTGLERLIGSIIDSAKLDDLLVSSNPNPNPNPNCEEKGGIYDVNLVVRLIRVFVQSDQGMKSERLIKVGKLIDQYLAEISPDHNLKISKFIAVAQSLPDLARDCFDGVYRAIDIYLESHPSLSFEERSRLCRCLNYEKLSLEACKDLAKNPRIPPRVAVQALACQRQVAYEPPIKADQLDYYYLESPTKNTSDSQLVLYNENGNVNGNEDEDDGFSSRESEDVKMNIQRMQCRVLELEKLCKEMKGQMSKLVKNTTTSNNNSNRPHRLC